MDSDHFRHDVLGFVVKPLFITMQAGTERDLALQHHWVLVPVRELMVDPGVGGGCLTIA